jgi:hypothetical protein
MASNRDVTEGVVGGIASEGEDRLAADAGKAGASKASARRKRVSVEPDKKVAKAPGRSQTGSKSVTSKITKAELILKKLRTAKGASMEELIAETGWQAHSVRGFLSAAVKKKLALDLVSESGKDGVRRYRIHGSAKTA